MCISVCVRVCERGREHDNTATWQKGLTDLREQKIEVQHHIIIIIATIIILVLAT